MHLKGYFVCLVFLLAILLKPYRLATSGTGISGGSASTHTRAWINQLADMVSREYFSQIRLTGIAVSVFLPCMAWFTFKSQLWINVRWYSVIRSKELGMPLSFSIFFIFLFIYFFSFLVFFLVYFPFSIFFSSFLNNSHWIKYFLYHHILKFHFCLQKCPG